MEPLKIFQLLLEREKMSFQEISEGQNRNKCNKILDELIGKGFAETEPQQWKKGQKKWFSLTKKGQQEGIKLTSANITEGLRYLDIFSSKLSPTDVKEMEDFEINADWNEMVEGRRIFKNKTFQEKVQIFTRKQAQPRKLIYDTIRRLHKIMVRLQRAQDDYSKYIAIIKGDGSDPLTIPLRLLEGIDFNGLFWISAISNLQDAKIKWKFEADDSVPLELLK